MKRSIAIAIGVGGMILVGNVTFTASAAPQTSTTASVSAGKTVAGGTGWRFHGRNICVRDRTGKVSDGLRRAVAAWSKADDIDLVYSRTCAGYKPAQTITVAAGSWSTYHGVCDRAQVWTHRGYLKPGLVTRAVVHLNTGCNMYAVEDRASLAAKALGKPIGLAERTAGSPASVMSSAWLPTTADYRLVERIYPW